MPPEKVLVWPHRRIWSSTDIGSEVRNTSADLRQLRDGHSSRRGEFQEEIARRQWTQLAAPMAKYDPKLVMGFYANAWTMEEGVRDKRSWV